MYFQLPSITAYEVGVNSAFEATIAVTSEPELLTTSVSCGEQKVKQSFLVLEMLSITHF